MSIATTGPRGVRFRSRLEARWAAFFTLKKWEWEYEPDVQLHGWIPDFVLTRKAILVEVKPAILAAELERHKVRIEASGWLGRVWLVGAVPSATLMRPGVSVWVEDAAWYGAVEQRLWVRAGNALQWRRMT